MANIRQNTDRNHIAYNAKGQRILIAHGNNVMTRYAYDNQTFRLLRQRSEKYLQNNWNFTPDGSVRQDSKYTCDLVGNIVASIEANVSACGIGGTNSLTREFNYDPLYRLLNANGRENSPTITPIWDDRYRSTDNTTTTAYTQHYSYDRLGNIQKLQHIGNNNFTRNFNYNTGHNTLQKVETPTPSLIEDFTYDACGNQLTAGTTRNYVWNAGNQLITYYNQAGSANPTIFAQYDYSGMNRVSKLVKTGTTYERIIYIDGVFEYHILENGVTYEKNEIHIMDDQSRIAMVRIGTPFPDDITDAITYNLENQVSSSVGRLDLNGAVIDREEYYPFGETSFGSYGKKRYKFSGKERDEESGLYYCRYRYHSAWTCRFISVDPLTSKYPHYCSYSYAGNMVVTYRELEGLEPIGAINPETKIPYHEVGFEIDLPNEVVPVYQRGNNGALAITQNGLDALSAAGYKIETASGTPYANRQMSTDPTQPMVLAVGGTTVTSSHSGSHYDFTTPNKYPQVLITPPETIQSDTEIIPKSNLNQKGGLFFSENSDPSAGALALPILIKNATSEIRAETNISVASAGAGVTRVITGAMFFMNSRYYSDAQVKSVQTALNAVFGFPITVNRSDTLPADQRYVGGTFTFNDFWTTSIPIMTPISTTVKITDLVP